MKKNIISEIINSLYSSTKCPNCQHAYAKDDIRILADADNICFVQLDCHNCMSPIIATVFVNSINNDVVSSNAAKNAKTSSKYLDAGSTLEKKRYARISPISSDEVLAIYNKVKNLS